MIEKIINFKLPIERKVLIRLFHIFLVIITVIIFIQNYKNGFINYNGLLKDYGTIAWYLLVYTIFSSLAFKIFTKIAIIQQAFLLRKWAGIAVFYFAFLHLLFYFLANGFSLEYLLTDIKNNPVAYISGILAFVLLIPLFISSAKAIKKIMDKKKWFLLHKLTHLVFILVAIHVAFIEFTKQKIEYEPFILLTIYFSGYIYLYYKNRKLVNK